MLLFISNKEWDKKGEWNGMKWKGMEWNRMECLLKWQTSVVVSDVWCCFGKMFFILPVNAVCHPWRWKSIYDADDDKEERTKQIEKGNKEENKIKEKERKGKEIWQITLNREMNLKQKTKQQRKPRKKTVIFL